MKRRVIFTRESARDTYRVEVFENDAPIQRQDGRSAEWCALTEHLEQIAGSQIEWNHRGVEPTLDVERLRTCVTYVRARA